MSSTQMHPDPSWSSPPRSSSISTLSVIGNFKSPFLRNPRFLTSSLTIFFVGYPNATYSLIKVILTKFSYVVCKKTALLTCLNPTSLKIFCAYGVVAALLPLILQTKMSASSFALDFGAVLAL